MTSSMMFHYTLFPTPKLGLGAGQPNASLQQPQRWAGVKWLLYSSCFNIAKSTWGIYIRYISFFLLTKICGMITPTNRIVFGSLCSIKLTIMILHGSFFWVAENANLHDASYSKKIRAGINIGLHLCQNRAHQHLMVYVCHFICMISMIMLP